MNGKSKKLVHFVTFKKNVIHSCRKLNLDPSELEPHRVMAPAPSK
jgi:hypothetical protein